MEYAQQLDAWIRQVGPWAAPALSLAAFIEYVFPPFPGDTFMLLGGVVVARGQLWWPLALTGVTLGGFLGTVVHYYLGTRLAHRLVVDPRGKWLGISLETLSSVARRMQSRGGTWLLLFNRFMPGVRSLVFLAAGAALVPWPRALGLGLLSGVAWNILILAAGVAVGGSVDRMSQLLQSYQKIAWSLVLVGCAGLAIRLWIRRRRS